MDLFEYAKSRTMENESPLASRLRPTKLEEVVGQQHIVGKDKLLYRAIKADKLTSVIFYGPPGTGKTTLAKVIANTTSADFTQINATVAGKKDMEEVVKQAQNALGMYGRKTILFIDEIHRLSKTVEEILYSAMEDYALDIIIGKGPSARSVRLDLPKFTLIGATTRLGAIAAPLRDRFGVQCRLEFYKPDELQFIITRAAEILGVEIAADGAEEIARRSRGTPRVANRLLKRVRDFAQVSGAAVITGQMADEALARLEVDRYGLDRNDRRILQTIVKTFCGGPVGIETIAAAVSEETDTIEDVIEPYLMQLGLLQRTPRGRIATRETYRYLGVPFPEKG